MQRILQQPPSKKPVLRIKRHFRASVYGCICALSPFWGVISIWNTVFDDEALRGAGNSKSGRIRQGSLA
jgi:hypothetical protein